MTQTDADTEIAKVFAAIRKQSPPDAWSRAVTLARRGGVSIDSRSDEEIAARVKIQGSPLSPSVTLYLEDVEWDCNCDSPLDACEHVAAVAIACRQGTETTSGARPLEYRLRRVPLGIFFERGVTTNEDEDERFHVIDVPLDALAAGRFRGPAIAATPDDLAIEKALRGHRRGVINNEAAPRVFRALARVDRVTLDGKPVRVSGEPRRPHVVVEDAPGGFRIRLEMPDLADDVLHPEVDVPLSGREFHALRGERIFGPDDVGELVGTVLPSLAKRVALDVKTKRLPSSARERPRMALTLRRDGDNLYVLPGIVYGDPPMARVDGERGERMVSLQGVVPLRDLEAEEALSKRLLHELGLHTGRGEELATEHALEFVASIQGFDGHIEGDGFEAFQLGPELVPNLSLHADDLELDFGGVDAKTVLRAWRQGSSLVRSSEGGFAPLPLDWLEQYGTQVSDLLAARAARDELPRSSLPDLARLCDELDAPPPPGFERLRVLVEDFTALPEADVPDALREYQRQGVNWLWFLKRAELGALLADDMGLGKTLQALCVLERRSLVVAPTSVVQNWVAEARRFRPELAVSVYHGPDRALDERADVTVTSHALLRIDREILSAVEWDTVVIDESQMIRNPDTELARAAYGLNARFRISLTGTPIENRLVDLWSQMHFLNPGFLGEISDFEERYVRPVERGESESLDRLRERIRPFFLRRLKSVVAPELPPRTEITLHAELTKDERDVYGAVRLAARRDALAALERKGNVLAALEALLRLRQAACHPALVPGQHAQTSSKTELLLEALETAASEGHKALVFSQWTSMLDLLEPHMAAHGLNYVRLDGSTRDRAAVVERFQTDDDVSVFLISLKAGGTGLNLTAADHVFLFDPWWNPAVEEQAFDRAHRIGQDKPVFVHRLVAANTVEERILALQEEKRALSDVTTSSKILTRDILLQLLE
ncbi:MAG: hypothetical protein BMS9Abin37_0034 [Acidobacteriota bacterium]|nr:MAG: hypothetical protein BMS9Abin37_0034 [Acidobacteriota bacterium]